MIINEHNYEAFLLDYLEDRLNPQDCKLLFDYLGDHPELKADLDINASLVLQSTDSVQFGSKDLLKKSTGVQMGLSDMDYLLIKEQEEGLTQSESQALSRVISETNFSKSELGLYAQLKLKPDDQMVYPHKKALRKGVFFYRFNQWGLNRVASVVLILLLSTVVWVLNDRIRRDGKALLSDAPVNEISSNEVIVEAFIPEAKILEKELMHATPVSPDSVKKMANETKAKPPAEKQAIQNPSEKKWDKEEMVQIASITELPQIQPAKINGYEAGLTAMMPQYFSNNLLSKELARIYKEIEATEKTPSMSIALVENGVKVVNMFSRDRLNLNKQYDEDGNLIGYNLTGENIELSRKAK